MRCARITSMQKTKILLPYLIIFTIFIVTPTFLLASLPLMAIKTPHTQIHDNLHNKTFEFVNSSMQAPTNALKDPNGNFVCMFEYDMRNNGGDRFQNVFGHVRNGRCMGEVWGVVTANPGQFSYVVTPRGGEWLSFAEAMKFRNHPSRSPAVFIMKNNRGTGWVMAIASIQGNGAKSHLEMSPQTAFGVNQGGGPISVADPSQVRIFVPKGSPAPIPEEAKINKNFRYIPSTEAEPADILKDPKGNRVCTAIFDDRSSSGDQSRYQIPFGYINAKGSCVFEVYGVREMPKESYYYVVAPKGKWLDRNAISDEVLADPVRNPVLLQTQNPQSTKWMTGLCAIRGFAGKTHLHQIHNYRCWTVIDGQAASTGNHAEIQYYVVDAEPAKSPAEADPASIFSEAFGFAPSTAPAPPTAVKDQENRPLCTFFLRKKGESQYFGVIGYQEPTRKTCQSEAWGYQSRAEGQYHFLVAEGEWSRFHEISSSLLTDKKQSLYVYQMNNPPHPSHKVGVSMIDKFGARFHDLPQNKASYSIQPGGNNPVAITDLNRIRYFVPRPKVHLPSPAEAYASSHFNKTFQFAPSDMDPPADALKDEKGNYVCTFVFDARDGGLGDNSRFISQFGYVSAKKQCMTEAWGVHSLGVGRWHYVRAAKGKWVPLNEVITGNLSDPKKSPIVFTMDNNRGHKFSTAIATIDGVAARHSDVAGKTNAWGITMAGAQIGSNDPKRVKIYVPTQEPIRSPAETDPTSIFSKLFSFAPSTAEPPANVIRDEKGQPLCTFISANKNVIEFFGAIGHVKPESKRCFAESWGMKVREPGEYHYLIAEGMWVRAHELSDDLLEDPEISLFVYRMDHAPGIGGKWKIGATLINGLAGMQQDIPNNWRGLVINPEGTGAMDTKDRNALKFFVPTPKQHIKSPSQTHPDHLGNRTFSFLNSDDALTQDVLKDELGNLVCTFVFDAQKTYADKQRLIGMVGYVNEKKQCVSEAWGPHYRPQKRYHLVRAPKGKWVPVSQVSPELLNHKDRSPYLYRIKNPGGVNWDILIASIDGLAGRTSLSQTGGNAYTVARDGKVLSANQASRVKVFVPNATETPSISARFAEHLYGSYFEFATSSKPAPSNALKDPKGNYVCGFVFDERKRDPVRLQIIFGHVLPTTQQCAAEAWGMRKAEEGEWEYVIPPAGQWVDYRALTEDLLDNNARSPLVAEIFVPQKSWPVAICAIDGVAAKTHLDKSCYGVNPAGNAAVSTGDMKRLKVYLPDDVTKLPLDASKIKSDVFGFTFMKDAPGTIKNAEGVYSCVATVDGQTQFGGVRDGKCWVHMNGKPQSTKLFQYVTTRTGSWQPASGVSKNIEELRKAKNSPIALEAQHGPVGACTFKGWPGKTHFSGSPCMGVDGSGNLFQAPITESQTLVWVP